MQEHLLRCHQGQPAPLPFPASTELVATTISGSDGRYEIHNLAPGDYRLEIVFPPYVEDVVAGCMVYIVCVDRTTEAILVGSVLEVPTDRIIQDFTITLLRDEAGLLIGPTFRVCNDPGRFELPGCVAGPVEIRLMVPGRPEVTT